MFTSINAGLLCYANSNTEGTPSNAETGKRCNSIALLQRKDLCTYWIRFQNNKERNAAVFPVV